ncbi:hypothetical protein JN531_003740 [Flagellatimonas centrodinii]|uniref:phage adaptor protein n=1 Tax=Flagellatimonas centrodinii TaxID=2806210 RepID=UPI001FFC4D97|nr:hypothetical protein [Flagellatimonas centrodinii]ULQ47399.1 hypothetical protein JN531_003740 [Flagellatimonas centrodinii]
MDLKALIAEFRVRADDKAAPYLWDDQTVTAYLNEAEAEAADRARLLRDSTSPFTTINVVAGSAVYPLDKLILGLDRVTLDGCRLTRTTVDEMDRGQGSWEARTGRPKYFIEDEDGRSVRLWPTPTAAGVLQLTVYRLPKCPLELDQQQQNEPEIHRRHHSRMIDWAVYLAFSRRNADEEDRRRAADADALFTVSFGERLNANVQRKQRGRRVPVVRARW